MGEWKPKIIAFCCNWCSYGGADTAGVGRMQYPPSTRIIRVMCSGRIEPSLVLKAFREGADGVFVGGCHLGDCHYQSGNYKWWRRAELLKKFLAEIGIEPERFRYEWISASEGEKFAEVMTEFHQTLLELGPLELRERLKRL
ncbi:hydrogenase iron-sulfur subunit [Methanopyrus kandleri]|uniref:Coenzyme F420-reducing hydrogenase, delta subunit n=2 Tax=Methanopyrus kandleri TaxID=2320 RepID=Q8TYM8_METKA|nr:hydrogenase iron-sulfur subunit [Methanopyrus kandleri]AAM01485.1 Coenzyme F420-reducing hydrogenase, delta subunit [Methanopyrus kandleri AV19]HII70589.1 hydrogenase iron-sulfur subunit [Methanopyrus kandleri]